MKNILLAMAATIFTIMFILAVIYVETQYTHGMITYSLCGIVCVTTLFLIFYAIIKVDV